MIWIERVARPAALRAIAHRDPNGHLVIHVSDVLDAKRQRAAVMEALRASRRSGWRAGPPPTGPVLIAAAMRTSRGAARVHTARWIAALARANHRGPGSVLTVTRLAEPPRRTAVMTVFPPLTRRAIAGAALSSIALLSAACGTSSAPPAGSATTATATATASGPTVSPTRSPGASRSPAGPAGPAPCPARSLGLKPGVSQGTAGSVYTVLDFTNISNVTCTLYGFPGVAQAGGHPVTQIGRAAAESHLTARQLVTLAPGAVASALLQIVDAGNYPPSRCGPVKASYLQIYPPNQTTPVYLAYSSLACSKAVRLLTVSAVRPGAGSAS